MLERTFVKAVICLMLLFSSSLARAQEEAIPSEPIHEAADDAHASVELSLSVAPQWLLAGAMPGGLGGVGALGGLGNGGWLPIALDVGFALGPAAFLVVGLGGGYSELDAASSWQVSVPLSLLFYLEEPRVGRVVPTLRIGGAVGTFGSRFETQRSDAVSGSLLARGGVTWIAAPWIALRAEVGAAGGVSAWLGERSATSFSFGLEASLAVVLRI